MSVYIFGIFVLLTINKSGFKKPVEQWELPSHPAIIRLGTQRAYPSYLVTPLVIIAGAPRLNTHWASGQGYRSWTTLALSWPPSGTNSIAVQELNKHMLGVLLTALAWTRSPKRIEYILLHPSLMLPKQGSPEIQSPLWLLAHSRHSYWTEGWLVETPRSKTFLSPPSHRPLSLWEIDQKLLREALLPVIRVMHSYLQYGKFHILPPSCIIYGLSTLKKSIDQGVELEFKEAFKSLLLFLLFWIGTDKAFPLVWISQAQG